MVLRTRKPLTKACIFLNLAKPSFLIICLVSNTLLLFSPTFFIVEPKSISSSLSLLCCFLLYLDLLINSSLLWLLIRDCSPAIASKDRLLAFFLSIQFINIQQMSYGWLTESALLPKKKKEIKVEDESSLFGLKAVMLREKEKMMQGSNKRAIYEVKRPTKNPGIEERIKRDQAVSSSFDNRIKDSARSMQLKQKVYEQLQSGKQNVSRLLVDFVGKAVEKDYENEDYQIDRANFYAGKLQELKKHREDAPAETSAERDFRQRIAWEKEMLAQLSGTVQQKVKVKQVFDRKMHEEEKEALTQVLKELSEEQRMKEEARKRRQQIDHQRILKLRKLRILPEDEQQQEREANGLQKLNKEPNQESQVESSKKERNSTQKVQ